MQNWARIDEHLRVLAQFQTMPWEQAQSRYGVLTRKLIDQYKTHKRGFSVTAVMQLSVRR